MEAPKTTVRKVRFTHRFGHISGCVHPDAMMRQVGLEMLQNYRNLRSVQHTDVVRQSHEFDKVDVRASTSPPDPSPSQARQDNENLHRQP